MRAALRTTTRPANNVADQWSRFVVVMLCAPGQEMLVCVDDEELEERRDRRAPRPVP
jgi:hypothetical protein